jgi:hypothetical protein
MAMEIVATMDTLADHPEQRPLAERCLENWAFRRCAPSHSTLFHKFCKQRTLW